MKKALRFEKKLLTTASTTIASSTTATSTTTTPSSIAATSTATKSISVSCQLGETRWQYFFRKSCYNNIPENLDIIDQSSFLIGNLQKDEQNKNSQILRLSSLESSNTYKGNLNFIYGELFVKLIKECKKRVHDQAFLKNYITYRMEKREQLNQEQTKELNKRLEKLKIWLNNEQKIKTQVQNNSIDLTKNTILTTGIQKAVNDSINLSDTKEKIRFNVKSTYNELNNAYTKKTE